MRTGEIQQQAKHLYGVKCTRQCSKLYYTNLHICMRAEKAEKLTSRVRIWEGKKGKWTRKVETRTRKKFLAVGKHAKLYSDLL